MTEILSASSAPEIKNIQQRIISQVIDANQYEQVSFLVPNDFRNWEDRRFKDLWTIIFESQGDFKKIWEAGRADLVDHMFQVGLLADTWFIGELGLILIEWNMDQLVRKTLDDLINAAPDESEMNFFHHLNLDWCKMVESKERDILTGIEALHPLVEAKVSGQAEVKIKEMTIRINNRIKTIKKITDGRKK